MEQLISRLNTKIGKILDDKEMVYKNLLAR